MSEVLEAVRSEATAGDMLVVIEQNPSLVLLDAAKADLFYDRIKAETDKLDATVKTSKGRDEIRAMAARVTRSKTAIDKARLDLTKQWRDQTDACNKAGREIKERLETLADDVRRPLTEWEEAEEARADKCDAIIKSFKEAAFVALGDTASSVRERGITVFETALDEAVFIDRLEEAQEAKAAAVGLLKAALARLEKEEADVAELQRLREENAAREAKELADKEVAAEALRVAEREIIEEQKKIDAAKAEQDRIAAAAAKAAQDAKDEAERIAKAAQDEKDRAAQAEIDAANARAATAERERQAEIDRQAAAQAEADRLAKVEADAKAQREADQENRRKVKTAAKEAIMSCGVSEDAAQKVVLAIIAGEVPHVTLAF